MDLPPDDNGEELGLGWGLGLDEHPITLPDAVLPENDDGTGDELFGQAASSADGGKGKQKLSRPKAKQKAKPKAKAALVPSGKSEPKAKVLPSGKAKPKAKVLPSGKAQPKAKTARKRAPERKDDDELPILNCEDDTLKKAASGIPSTVKMPHSDLEALLQNPPGLTSLQNDPCNVWEVFTIPRLGPVMRELGGKCKRSYDIRHFWDLNEESYQRTLLQDIALFTPLCVMMSPPCTYLCQLMHSNWKRMQPQKRLMNLVQACAHIDLCMWIAKFQITHRHFFALEHPAGSLIWERESAAHRKLSSIYFFCFACWYCMLVS